MAERTPVVKKYRDALETVIGATMEFLAQAPPSHPGCDSSVSSPVQRDSPSVRGLRSGQHDDGPSSLSKFSPSFVGAAQESYVRGIGQTPPEGASCDSVETTRNGELYGYMEAQPKTVPTGRREGRHGETGQMDAEWLLSLCEGDGFSLSMLNEMMRFEPSLGA
jgi:hypothetical protein